MRINLLLYDFLQNGQVLAEFYEGKGVHRCLYLPNIFVQLRMSDKLLPKLQNLNINDSNKELINMYNVIKNNHSELIELLKIHQSKYSDAYYERIRKWTEVKIMIIFRMLKRLPNLYS